MEKNSCKLCGEPMQEAESMFMYHGSLGPCPDVPLKTKLERKIINLQIEIENMRACIAGLEKSREEAVDQLKELNVTSTI